MTITDIPTQQPAAAECPAHDMRKTHLHADHASERYTVGDDGTWTVRGFDEVRQILRSNLTQQDGFGAEYIDQATNGVMRKKPILFLEGEEHHTARRETNRFFTPSVTDRDYRDFMNDYADTLIERLQERKRLDLSEISMDMAVMVASRIVGLTDSLFEKGAKQRLEAMIENGNRMIHGEEATFRVILGQWVTLRFYLLDVLPAIRARRKNPQEDVISYLLEKDYSHSEVLAECIVYGVAGMVTTREFIAVALWHLLENPHLAERMRVGEQAERYAILHEILRLEPVVSHIYRRTTEELTFQSNGETVSVPADTRLDLHVAAANLDEHAMGQNPQAVCPMRERAEMRPKVSEFGLSFGDGAHRCPGAYVAIQESDIFLRKLLALPSLRIEKEPTVSYFEIAESYEVRDFIIAID